MDIMKKYKQGDLDEVPSAKTANDPMNPVSYTHLRAHET